jgi:hypothetical protein
MLRALPLALALAGGSAAAQDVGTLLAQTLGAGAVQTYWLPDSADPVQAREALGVAYIPIEGSAGSVSISVGYYAKGSDGFAFVGAVADLFGGEPRDQRFLADRIEVTTTMPAPGDPRCCPTGTARWAIDRGTLTAERLN